MLLLSVPHQQAPLFCQVTEALTNFDAIGTFNWAKFVLDWLCEEVNKLKTKKQTYSDGFLLLLMVHIV